MNVFLINSTPEVDKFNLHKNFQTITKSNFGFIVCDYLGRISPYRLSREWMNIIQDNIISCINNFYHYGINSIIVSFLFPSEERINRITTLLNKEKFMISYFFSL